MKLKCWRTNQCLPGFRTGGECDYKEGEKGLAQVQGMEPFCVLIVVVVMVHQQLGRGWLTLQSLGG